VRGAAGNSRPYRDPEKSISKLKATFNLDVFVQKRLDFPMKTRF